MSGASVVPSVLDRLRRTMLLQNENDMQSLNGFIISRLDELSQRLRASHNGHQFSPIGIEYRSELYMTRLPMCGCETSLRGSHI
jgi:hypothetical protein